MKHRRKLSKKTLFVAGAVVIAVVAGLWLWRSRDNGATEPVVTNPPGTEKIDLSPPTDEDKQAADDRKEEIEQEEAAQNANTGGSRTVTPVITDASQYDDAVEVTAYVSGVIEGSGTCIITFTKGSSTVTREVAGIKDATTTRCTNVSIPSNEFSAGSWSVNVKYQSGTAQGSSQTQKVEIQ